MRYLICLVTLLCAGCASNIMERYVGRDITAVIASYGPPFRTFNVPGGRSAYQWRIIEQTARPKEIDFESQRDGGDVTGNITIWDTQVRSQTCYYTFYTRENGAFVTIVGFEPPPFECE